MAYAREGAIRKFQVQQAKGREALGIPAAYGAPVMMPPTNRLGGALQIASQVASIYSGFGGGPLKFPTKNPTEGLSGGLFGSSFTSSPLIGGDLYSGLAGSFSIPFTP